MSLVFFAADTFGVTLYQLKDHLAGSEVHQVKLGPWRLDLQIDVTSDLMTGQEMSFWITLGKRLRLYAIVRDRENVVFVLNTDTLKACGATTGFKGLTTKARVQEFKSAITGVFRWVGDTWERVDI